MWSARFAIATTSFEDDAARENGFEGKLIVAVDHSASSAGWMWTVESQAAETMRECSLLYTTERTPLSCVLNTVCVPEPTSILRGQPNFPGNIEGGIPSNVPIQACSKDFVVVFPKAHVENGRSMLELGNLSAGFAIGDLVDVGISVP